MKLRTEDRIRDQRHAELGWTQPLGVSEHHAQARKRRTLKKLALCALACAGTYHGFVASRNQLAACFSGFSQPSPSSMPTLAARCGHTGLQPQLLSSRSKGGAVVRLAVPPADRLMELKADEERLDENMRNAALQQHA